MQSLKNPGAIIVALLATLGFVHAQIPAFPGAQGFGAYSTGGRGGDVYHVVNLNTSGTGSFADAIATVPANGRTIVFDVSGYIHVNKTSLAKNKVTIAGQTAPGDGIGFKDGSFYINGDNVIIRHARYRYGDKAAGGDCIDIGNGVTNLMMDHLSVQFSTDENISSFEQSPRPDYMTLSWTLNAWGLESHSCGGLWDVEHVTTHHNLWAHHHTRNPKARPSGLLDWINNVTYDWDIGFIMGDSTTPANWKANVRGNYFICPPGNTRSVALEKALLDRNGGTNFTLYVQNNLFDKNGNTALDGSDYGYGIASGVYIAPPVPIVHGTSGPLTIDPPLLAYKKIVSAAGALRLDAESSQPLRDEVDRILVTNLVTLKRNHVSHENQTGASNNGMGTLNSTSAPADSDRDGMPDHWEATLGSNAGVQDHNTLVPNSGGFITGLTFFPSNTVAGYTLLEEYLHFLAIPHATIPKNVVGAPSSLNTDLRKFTAGFTKAPVVFTLSNITNGIATLQPDGYTVVFEPTTNFSGRARFDFTVSDADGQPWKQMLAVLVSTVGLPRDLKWKGDGAANLWSTNALNFHDGTNLTAYGFGDNVLIDDSGSNTPAINLTMSASPSSLEVNATKNYTFTGPGALSGAGPLTKAGSGTLTLSTTNSGYSGSLDVSGGTLAVSGGASIGSGAMTIGNGATFSLPPSGTSYFFGGSVAVPGSQTANITSGVLSSGIAGNVTSGDDNSVLNLSGGISFGGTSTAQFDGFTGTINLNPGATLRYSAGSSGNTYGSLNPTFIINGTMQPRNAGNTVRLGALTGSGTIAGPQSNSGTGATTYSVGANNVNATFNGVISSNTAVPGSLVGLTKLGTGKLTLTGNNTYSGTTAVGAGTLLVNGTNANSAVTVSNAATFGGSGRIGALVTVNSGGKLAPGNSAGTLNLGGGLTLNSASLNFEFADVTTVGGGVNDLVALTGGLLTLTGTSTVNPTFLNGSMALGTYTLITGGSSTIGSAANLAWGTAGGGRQTFAFDTTTPGTVQLVVGGSPAASLVWNGATTGDWDSATTNWLNGVTPDKFYNLDAVLFDATGASAPVVTLTTAVSPAALTVNAANNYTFNGPGVLTGPGALTKSGAGTLTIATTNTGFTGSITVAGGLLFVNNGGSIGNGAMTISNGANFGLPTSGGAVFFGGPITIPANQTGTISSGALGNGLSGNLFSGNSNSVLNLSGGVSFGGTTSAQFDGFTGTINIQPGATLRFSPNSSGNTYGSLNPTFIINGTFQPRNAGNTLQLGALTGSGMLTGPQSSSGGGNSTYFIGGNNSDATFTGVISSNTAVAGSLVVLNKVGTGKLTLGGNNTYTGGTTVSAGTLVVNNATGSGTGSGDLLVQAGATLAGTGFIGSATDVADFAVLAPGSSAGTLTFNNELVLGEFSILNFELGTNSDSVVANGALTLSGTVNVTALGGFGPGTYTLFTYNPANAFNYGSLNLGTAPGGYNYALSTNTSGQVNLLVSPVTPPSFGQPFLSGGNLILSGTGGTPGADYYLLTSTNVVLPLVNWTPLATNQFDGSGNFAFTNAVNAGTPQLFYRLQVP